MLHTGKNNNKIKHLHKHCLRLNYSDKESFYENLLEKVTLHTLATINQSLYE